MSDCVLDYSTGEGYRQFKRHPCNLFHFFSEYSQKRGKSTAKFPMQCKWRTAILGPILLSLSYVKKVFNMICEIELDGFGYLNIGEYLWSTWGQLGFLVVFEPSSTSTRKSIQVPKKVQSSIRVQVEFEHLFEFVE
jgi:hypothetical protein